MYRSCREGNATRDTVVVCKEDQRPSLRVSYLDLESPEGEIWTVGGVVKPPAGRVRVD